MQWKYFAWLILFLILNLSFSGCTSLTVPQGGSGTVKVVEGGFVETIVFGGGATLNMQITREDVEEYEYILSYPVLTIGRFSPVIGSGFTQRSNIYYESRIGPDGHDTFEAVGGLYRVFWRETGAIPQINDDYASVFSVTVEQIGQ